jgi:transposase
MLLPARTVHRIFKQFELNGDVVAASPRSRRPEIRLLDERCELILESPTMYLLEICQQIKENTSLSVSQATMCRLL